MYRVRLLSSRFSRSFEVVYNLTKPIFTFVLKKLKIKNNSFLDKLVIFLEKNIKGFLFDCKMCGNCILSSTGMTCPMNCPKTIRNGPCGGVRADGSCEVNPSMPCVWVQAWQGAAKMKNGNKIQKVQFTVNNNHKGTSSWIRLAKEEVDCGK